MARIMELKHNQKPIKFKQVSSSQLLIPKRKFGKLSQCKDGSNQKIKDSLYNDFELFRRKKINLKIKKNINQFLLLNQ